MGQAESEVGNAVEYHAQEHVIRHAGRPVLHVPLNYKGEHVGKKVVIGWSPTREAARAVHDALPLLAPGAEVSVVEMSCKRFKRKRQKPFPLHESVLIRPMHS